MSKLIKKSEYRPRCPKCGSRSTASKGVRRTQTLGVRPLRSCRACGHRFTAPLPVSR